MKQKLLIDIGSSTVKIYLWNLGSLTLLQAKSIAFKKDFNPKKGISKLSEKELFEVIKNIQKQHKNIPIFIYATAVFRKFEKTALDKFAARFFKKTKVKFRVISQRLENAYLEKALIGKYNKKNKVLLINVGGGSTELVVMEKGYVVETKNLDLGVSNVLLAFSKINEGIGKTSLERVKEFVDKKLPNLKSKVNIAFYSGGELTYMSLAGYNLKKNTLFEDNNHPQVISLKDFKKRNKEIFNKVFVKDLEKLMPQNPTWMHGARACSAFVESICQRYGIETIIPSDSNLIDGVVRRDFK